MDNDQKTPDELLAELAAKDKEIAALRQRLAERGQPVRPQRIPRDAFRTLRVNHAGDRELRDAVARGELQLSDAPEDAQAWAAYQRVKTATCPPDAYHRAMTQGASATLSDGRSVTATELKRMIASGEVRLE